MQGGPQGRYQSLRRRTGWVIANRQSPLSLSLNCGSDLLRAKLNSSLIWLHRTSPLESFNTITLQPASGQIWPTARSARLNIDYSDTGVTARINKCVGVCMCACVLTLSQTQLFSSFPILPEIPPPPFLSHFQIYFFHCSLLSVSVNLSIQVASWRSTGLHRSFHLSASSCHTSENS